jgi:predicted Zn-dependent protease
MKRWTAVLILLASAACGQQFTPEKEAALGEQMAAACLKEATPIESKSTQAWVEQTGSRLAAHAETPFKFRFVVIAGDTGPTHEPRSFPGGYIVIPAQLFLACRDDAEFAGMLAHAMAHVVNRDATRAATAVQRDGRVPLLPSFPGDRPAGLAVPVAYRSIMRQYEAEADATAARMMREAGYDPPGGPGDEFRAIQDRIRPIRPTLFRPGEQRPQ